MTPQPAQSPKWWQTLIIMAVNVGLGILGFHFGGASAGAAAMSAGTAIAHLLPSPLQK
jgi:hypothetical protein